MSTMMKLCLLTSPVLNVDSAAVTLTVMFIDSRVSHRCRGHRPGGGQVGSSNFDGVGLNTWGEHGGSMGGLKCCQKIPVKEFI